MPDFAKIQPRLVTALIILLYLLLPFAAFPEIIFGGQTLYWSDLSWIHYPRHLFAASEWLAGRTPLWDPYQHNGLPFLAETQAGTLYLFSAIFLSPLSPSLELSLFVLVHFSLGAIFTFILARSLSLTHAPAAVAGLAFGFGGFLMAQVANLNIMTGAVWLPLILYGLIQTERRRSWLAALLTGLPLALQISTAQPQIVFYSLVTVGGYSLYRLAADFFGKPAGRQNRMGYAGRTLLLMAIPVASGLLLAAPQWLSTLELQRLSVRSGERSFEFLTNNSLPPVMWLNLLIPSAFGNNVTGFKGGDPFQEDFIYLGLIPLLLIFFSPAQRHKRNMLFFLLLLAGGILLASGRYTPLYQYVIQHLPGFALFRIPSRWLMVANLALAVLAGYGLQTVLDRGLTRQKVLILGAAGGVLLAGAALLWFFGDAVARWSEPYLSNTDHRLLTVFLSKGYTVDPAYQNRLWPGGLNWLTAPVLLLAFNFAVAITLFTLFSLKKIGRNAFSILLVIAVSLDLAAAGGITINPTQPASWWTQLSGGAKYVLDNINSGQRVFPLGMGSERATVSHLGQYFPSVYRVRSAGGHGSSLMLARTSEFLEQAHPVQAIKVLGVRYILTEGQMGADAAATYPIAYSDAESFVYENPRPLPRAFVVHDLVRATTPDEALAHLQGTAIDPAQTVIIESSKPLPQPDQAAGASSAAAIVTEHPQRIEVAVDAAANGYLVLLDTFYPGWEATVDDQPAIIYRANYVGRAVFVPQGQHTVVFEYRPKPFKIGVWLSISTLAVIVIAVIIKGWRSRTGKG